MADETKAPNKIQALEQQLAEMRALLAQMQAGQAGNEAVRLLAERSAPVNNPNYNETSVFTYPEGERVRPKPTLRRDTFFCGMRQRNEELTPQEIDLFNAVDSTRRITGKNYGDWTAEVRRNGTSEELHVNVPAGSVDARMELPSLSAILSELLTGEVQKSAAEVQAELLAKVAELERRLAVA